MGKKKQSNNKPRPTQSFEQLVGKEALNRLKPYVDQQVNSLGQKLANYTFGSLAEIVRELEVLKDILKKQLLTDDADFRTRLITKEDEAVECTESEYAKNGDRLHAKVCGRFEKDSEFGEYTELPTISKLGSEPYSSGCKEIEEALVGKKKGDEFEVPRTQTNKVKNKAGELVDKESTYVFKVFVERVSAYPEASKGEKNVG